jgi:hypothetical protein
MEKISDRIMKIIKEEGISARALEQKIGCSNGVLSKSILKGTDVSGIWLSKIIETLPNYNARWLMTGEGEMFLTQKQADVGCQVKNCDFMDMIDRKDKRIYEMAEEIGKLKQEVFSLKKGSNMSAYNLAAEP